MMTRPTCIVIGAGLAGLAAAYRLSKKGWKVEVLEAHHQHVGGRVLSHHFRDAPDLVCELGAEWIGDDHNLMLSLCAELELPIQSHRFALSFWNGSDRGGRVYAPDAWCFGPKLKRRFHRFARSFSKLTLAQQKELDNCDWWSRLQWDDIGFSPKELAKRDLMDSTDSGESIRLTSAYSAAAEYCTPSKSRTDEMDYKVAGGNHLLIERLEQALASFDNRLQRGARVHAIAHERNRVKVFVNGRRAPYVAQCCICAVPAPALTDIDWVPRLSPHRTNMIRQLQYSRIMKSAVLYNERFWTQPRVGGFSVFTNRASDFCFESSYGQSGTKGILCSYAIGDKADDLTEERNKNNVMKWITEDVAAATRPDPKTRVAPIDIETKSWQREPGIGGAYAFYRPGQWFSVRPALKEPHQRVYFAGEHLSDNWQGFMEGAAETGFRAASEIIRRFGLGQLSTQTLEQSKRLQSRRRT